MILGSDGRETPRSCPVLSNMFLLPPKNGIQSAAVQTLEPNLVQASCALDSCRWWISEKQECAIVVLARKGLENA